VELGALLADALAEALAGALADALAEALAVLSSASAYVPRTTLAAKARARVTTASHNLVFVHKEFVIFFSLSSSMITFN